MRDLTVRERKKKKKPVSVNNFRYCNYEDHDLFYVLWLFPIYCAEEVPPPPAVCSMPHSVHPAVIFIKGSFGDS